MTCYTDRFGLATLMGCYADLFGLNAECVWETGSSELNS
jgi:hypothetical protein